MTPGEGRHTAETRLEAPDPQAAASGIHASNPAALPQTPSFPDLLMGPPSSPPEASTTGDSLAEWIRLSSVKPSPDSGPITVPLLSPGPAPLVGRLADAAVTGSTASPVEPPTRTPPPATYVRTAPADAAATGRVASDPPLPSMLGYFPHPAGFSKGTNGDIL